MGELPNHTYDRIRQLCAEGDELADSERFADAIGKYRAAWDLLPEPRTQWEAATWILGAIGDASFLGGDFGSGRDALTEAMHCPDAIGNPFLHLRLGQCQLELGNHARAADELARAYMSEGYDLFADEDPKYFQFLKTQLEPPPGGWEDE